VYPGLPVGVFSDQKDQKQIGFFGILWNWKALACKIFVYIMAFGLFFAVLVYFMAIWYVCCHFGTFFTILVFCTKKNLASLVYSISKLDIFYRCTSFVKKREKALIARNSFGGKFGTKNSSSIFADFLQTSITDRGIFVSALQFIFQVNIKVFCCKCDNPRRRLKLHCKKVCPEAGS
jgi:hypothetical protein